MRGRDRPRPQTMAASGARFGRAGGLTLLEVVVALVVLQLGVLGTAGLLSLAARTMTRAEALEAGVAVVELVADSLRDVTRPTDGRRPAGAGVVRWRVRADGTVELTFVARARGASFGVVAGAAGP